MFRKVKFFHPRRNTPEDASIFEEINQQQEKIESTAGLDYSAEFLRICKMIEQWKPFLIAN